VSIEEVVRSLGPANLGLATEIARIPELIRGYGHVKARHLEAARPKWDALMAEWRAGPLRVGTEPGELRPSAFSGDTIPTTQPVDYQLRD